MENHFCRKVQSTDHELQVCKLLSTDYTDYTDVVLFNNLNDMEENFLYKDETYQIIGALMEVHKTLGCGFLESVYQEALAIELEYQNIPFVAEKKLYISYKGIRLEKHYIADFVCFDSIIVELKALSMLTSDHEAQILNYLKATGLKVGLLVNFGEKSLKHKRFAY